MSINVGIIDQRIRKLAEDLSIEFEERLNIKNDAVKQLKVWFDKFDIGSWWNRKVEELSKGMQQKVQFIVTVLHKPQLLIFDEPFSGFDPINVRLLKEEILNLQNEGSTVIFSTHNMASVE